MWLTLNSYLTVQYLFYNFIIIHPFIKLLDFNVKLSATLSILIGMKINIFLKTSIYAKIKALITILDMKEQKSDYLVTISITCVKNDNKKSHVKLFSYQYECVQKCILVNNWNFH